MSNPNPGHTPVQRRYISILAGSSAALVAVLMVDWPVMIAGISVIGPLVVGALVGSAAWIGHHQKLSTRELAIQEFSHLGLSDDLIETVVIRGIEAAARIKERAANMHNPANFNRFHHIANGILAVIDDFKNDPSDARASRSTLNRVIEQTDSILSNYLVIESFRTEDKDAYLRDAVRTEEVLNLIVHTLTELRRSNMDNNRLALDVGLEVSEQLLQQRVTR
jgi:hypothetical protein